MVKLPHNILGNNNLLQRSAVCISNQYGVLQLVLNIFSTNRLLFIIEFDTPSNLTKGTILFPGLGAHREILHSGQTRQRIGPADNLRGRNPAAAGMGSRHAGHGAADDRVPRTGRRSAHKASGIRREGNVRRRAPVE